MLDIVPIMTVYLYCITNKINNKSYVGQSIDVNDRWDDHIKDAQREIGKTANTKKFAIHNAIAKYGVPGFTWQVIDQVETVDEANEAEEFFITYLNTMAPNGYNLTSGGGNARPSETTKKKISEKLKIVGSFVGKSGPDHPNFGTKQSEERKQATSKRLSGDGGPGKKINSQIAREIYLTCLNNPSMYLQDLSNLYGLKRSAIHNIIRKKCWKDATKDLPPIDLQERVHGEGWVKSKLKERDVLNIIETYKAGLHTMQKLAEQFGVSLGAIHGIISGKNWKSIKR